MVERSLDDIRYVLDPTFTPAEVSRVAGTPPTFGMALNRSGAWPPTGQCWIPHSALHAAVFARDSDRTSTPELPNA